MVNELIFKWNPLKYEYFRRVKCQTIIWPKNTFLAFLIACLGEFTHVMLTFYDWNYAWLSWMSLVIVFQRATWMLFNHMFKSFESLFVFWWKYSGILVEHFFCRVNWQRYFYRQHLIPSKFICIFFCLDHSVDGTSFEPPLSYALRFLVCDCTKSFSLNALNHDLLRDMIIGD